MKVLIGGGGGREHALTWKIAQSPKIRKIYCAPGNAGTAKIAENVNINPEDVDALAEFAEKEKIDLTVIGPEAPYVNGVVDKFRERGLQIFGPTKKASVLEGSKIFSQDLKLKYGIPTPLPSKSFYNRDYWSAIGYIHNMWRDYRKFVVKADGLAAGKGALVCDTREEACEAVLRCMRDGEFGEAGNSINIQMRLYGWELSSIGLTDGKTYLPLEHTQDHKPIGDNDTGPNTGGMGAYSPVPSVTPNLDKEIREKIMMPTIQAMEREGMPYQGVLYAGLIVVEENGREKPVDLEYNIRFGDPEMQPVVMRMKSDLIPYLLACIDGTLDKLQPMEWDDRWAVCVVIASGGYPGKYEKGKLITGLEEVEKMKDVFVFHAGTKMQDGKIYTSGGRVLGVTALGYGKEAIEKAYAAIKPIKFDNMYFRRDIGAKALKYLYSV